MMLFAGIDIGSLTVEADLGRMKTRVQAFLERIGER